MDSSIFGETLISLFSYPLHKSFLTVVGVNMEGHWLRCAKVPLSMLLCLVFSQRFSAKEDFQYSILRVRATDLCFLEQVSFNAMKSGNHAFSTCLLQT